MGQECALEVSLECTDSAFAADVFEEDFALTEASFATVRILQTFANIRLPEGYPTDPTGQERQLLTVLVLSADGCKVVLK